MMLQNNIKPKNVIIGPLPPGIGGIATITGLLHNEFKNDETFTFINTDKLPNKISKILRPFRFLKQILLTIKRNKVGVVLMFSSAYNSFWEKCIWCYIFNFFGIKTVVLMVDGRFPTFYEQLPKFIKYLSKGLVKNFDIIATQSPFWQSYYKTLFPNNNIQVINPGINTDYFIPIQQKKINKPIQLLYVGWMIKNKGIYDLLEALSILSKKNIQYKLSIVGPDYGNKETIKENTIKLNIDSFIEFTGELASMDDLLKSYQNADIFVFPSHYEGFPYALMEAISCGLPCVGTRVGGIPDILNNGKNGILVNAKNPTELAEGIRTLIENDQYRKEIGLLARMHAMSNYSISKSIKDFKKILNIKDGV